MCFETDGVVVAVALKGGELARPVDDACADGRPFPFAIGLADNIFSVAVADAFFGQQVVAFGERVAGGEGGGVAWIPVEHEAGFGHGAEGVRGFSAGGRVAGHFIFEQQDEVVAGAFARGVAEFFVDGGAIGLHVIETPEIEAADAVGVESFGELDAVVEQVFLLFEGEVGLEVVAAFALFGKGCAGPVGLEERAGDVGDAQIVFGEDGFGAFDVGVGHVGDVLAPHAAQLDPLEAEVVGNYGADVIEVLRDFVVDGGDAEGAGVGYGASESGEGCGRGGSGDEFAARDGHGGP